MSDKNLLYTKPPQHKIQHIGPGKLLFLDALHQVTRYISIAINYLYIIRGYSGASLMKKTLLNTVRKSIVPRNCNKKNLLTIRRPLESLWLERHIRSIGRHTVS